MVFFNYSTMQMAAKVVYYGPGLCGKTTNLQWIFDHTTNDSRGEMVSLATETDRTLFFDLLPIDVGSIAGFSTRIQLYTVPGQVFYNTTRKLVLKGVDGVVFVADSQRPMVQANLESFQNLEENLEEMGLSLDTIPVVLQYNKRDLPNICSIEEMQQSLNRGNWPYCEASALNGDGVFETLKTISKATLMALKKRLTKGRSEGAASGGGGGSKARPAPRKPTPPPQAPKAAPATADTKGVADTGPVANPTATGTAPPKPAPPKPAAAPPKPAVAPPPADAAAEAPKPAPPKPAVAPPPEAKSAPESSPLVAPTPEPAELPSPAPPASPKPAPSVAPPPEPAAVEPPKETAAPEPPAPAPAPKPAAPAAPPAAPAPATPAASTAPAPVAAPPAATPTAAAPVVAVPSAPRKSRKKRGGLDALAELEKLRTETIRSKGSSRNGKNEINRDVQMSLKRSDLERAERFSLSLRLEDADHQVVDEVRVIHVDIEKTAEGENLLLRLNIALDGTA